MATNKAKRSTHLSQPSHLAQPNHLAQPTRLSPNPEPAPLLPVKAHAYRALADFNTGLEKVSQDLKALESIGFFQSGPLRGVHNLICRIRAQTNRQLMTILTEREMANASHFDRIEWENVQEGSVSK